ncbi:type II secretion system F family protein [Picosynechococcus sp. PCC 7117]|uniref:type II secretion system F family protein n=1 Tax=Picosynechococcus sp. PCC 7117 TaxID=195498 RepID=UPI00081069D0|nr:type II secretion system F family protein [Picosynechococcus sp. PCC 7117]ANV88410.1 Type II secretory pathway [Picosynechococcus sp. PCC 7117]
MKEQQQALFFRQLGSTLKAGMGLGQAVALAMGEIPRRQREPWQGVILQLERGHSLRESWLPVRSQFSAWAIALLEMAETSGALVTVCRDVSDTLVEMAERRRLIRGMLLRGLVMVWSWVMVIYLLLGGSLLAGDFGTTALVTAIALMVFLYGAITWEPLRLGLRRVPPLRNITRLQMLIHLGYLQLPLDCGLPLTAAIAWLAEGFPDPDLQTICRRIEPQVRRGTDLTTAIAPYFSPMVRQIIRSGETAGTLPLSFSQIRQYYQRELFRRFTLLRVQILLLSLLSFGVFVALLGADVIQSMQQQFEAF